MDDTRDLLATLIELEGLDRIPRIGYAARGVESPESVAEHSFHLALLVWTLGRSEPLDLERAMAIALVHDLAEVRTGDLPRTVAGHLPAGAKHALEASVMAELFGEGHEAIALFEEYVANQTVEARFVHACDRLQLLLKSHLYERWRTGDLGELLNAAREPSGFPSIARIEVRLAEARAERNGR
ncbi:MAG TPA: HD domain-containing protein [Thermoanaerobaculia bacterium]|nr:HD domain-containing protein [Thermoanaerobaculia bacterium]